MKEKNFYCSEKRSGKERIMPTIANGKITIGKLYYFKNKAFPDFALNVWCSNAYPAKPLSNVCLWEFSSKDQAQMWAVTGSTSAIKFVPICNTSLYLDRYTGTGAGAAINAHLYTYSSTADFTISNGTRSDTIRIRAVDGEKVLTAYSGANGKRDGKTAKSIGNVYFADSDLSDARQEWIPVAVSSSSGATTTEVTVTDMPKISTYKSEGYKEYFHSGSGMKNGTWKANGGENIAKKIAAFYKKVFKEESTEEGNSTEEENPSEEQYLYSLYGSKTISDDPKFNLTYHHGFDINKYAGATVRTAHAGVVTKATGNTIAIYDEGKM